MHTVSIRFDKISFSYKLIKRFIRYLYISTKYNNSNTIIDGKNKITNIQCVGTTLHDHN